MNRYILLAGGLGLLLIIAGFMPRLETVKSRPVAKASAPTAANPPALSAEDQSAYDREIEYLKGVSDVKTQGGAQMQQLGALDAAFKYNNEAVTYIQMASCMNSQRKTAVPFYEAKARCKAAEG
jgi:hypothetical protein